MNDRPANSGSGDPRGEFPFAPSDYVFVLLTSIVRHRDARIERILRPLGLNVARSRALLVIHRLQPCTMTELAQFAVVERTTMTRTLDQLVGRNWVRRMGGATDRRQVVLSLTEDGAAKAEAGWRLIREQNARDLDGIPDQAHRTLIRLSQDLAANLAEDADTRERLLAVRRPMANGT